MLFPRRLSPVLLRPRFYRSLIPVEIFGILLVFFVFVSVFALQVIPGPPYVCFHLFFFAEISSL